MADPDTKLTTTIVDGLESVLVTCPHCLGEVYIPKKDIQCGVLRHAVNKSNLEPTSPHSAKAELDRLLAAGEIYGCAGPFRITNDRVEICDYI